MDKNEPVKEVNISYDSKELSKNAWMDAIRELSVQPSARPKTPSPVDTHKSEDTTPGTALPVRDSIQEPKRRQASEEMLLVQTLDKTRVAYEALVEFAKAHPYLIALNISRMWEDSLKESVVMLERELEKYRNRESQ